jgi:hypothetical protein
VFAFFLQDLEVDGKIILKHILKKKMGEVVKRTCLAEAVDESWAFVNTALNLK